MLCYSSLSVVPSVRPSLRQSLSFTVSLTAQHSSQLLSFLSHTICYGKIPTRSFYRATRSHSADCAVARCLSVYLSVCPSHAGILSKRLNISSKFFHRWVARHSSFSTPNGMIYTPTGVFFHTPCIRRPLEYKGYQKMTIFSLYLGSVAR